MKERISSLTLYTVNNHLPSIAGKLIEIMNIFNESKTVMNICLKKSLAGVSWIRYSDTIPNR
jgi:hypothetical protein